MNFVLNFNQAVQTGLIKALLLLNLYGLLFMLPVQASGQLSGPKSIDIGKIEVDQTKSFDFDLVNTSTEDVTITSVKGSCSCTDIIAGSQMLMPNARGIIKGNIHFSGALGTYKTNIFIEFKDKSGNKGDTTVQIVGVLVAPFELDKSIVNYGKVDQAAAPSPVIIDIRRANSGDDWDDIQVDHEKNGLQTDIEKVSNDLFRLVIRLIPNQLPIAAYHSDIKLYPALNGKRLMPSKSIVVSAQVTGTIQAYPNSIYLGILEPNATLERNIKIVALKQDLTSFKVINYPNFVVISIKRATKNSVEYNVQISAPEKLGPINQKIIFLHESTGVHVEVPVLGLARQSLHVSTLQ